MSTQQYRESARKCPMCGCSNSGAVYHYQDEFTFFAKLPREFDIVSCKNCGFIYSDIIASQDIYDEYYAKLSVYDNLGVTYGTVLDDNSSSVYKQRAKEIAALLSKDAAILEIGSANGFLLEELRRLGFQNLSALDLSENTLNGLSQRGFQTYMGGIFSESISSKNDKPLTGQFDCVCLTQVMEHIYDVQGAVKNMMRMLRPGGYLYIEVPDVEHFNEFQSSPFDFFNYEHIGYFDETSLRNLAMWNNLNVAAIIHRSVHFSTEQDTYPCIVGVFQKPRLIRSTSDTVVREYVLNSERKMEEYVNLFRGFSGEIAFWGMGTFARQLLKRVNGVWNIKYLIDSNQIHEGKHLLGHQIYAPSKLLEEHFSGTIFITTTLYADEVVGQIKEMNLNCDYKKMIDLG